MSVQLALDGAHTAHPTPHPRPLSRRQRELVAYMRAVGDVRPLTIGLLMYAGRPLHDGHGSRSTTKLRHASSDGVDALKRLEARGLVERVERGRWRTVEHDESGWA